MVDIQVGRFQLVIERHGWVGLRLGRYNVWWSRGEGLRAEHVPAGIKAGL